MSENIRQNKNGAMLSGKRGLIMGVATYRSIAWAIAQECFNQSATLAFSFHGEALGKRVRTLANSVNSTLVLPCDASDISSISYLFEQIKDVWGSLDFIVHSIAYSDKAELKGRYISTKLDNFSRTMAISCYSLTAVAQHAEPLMRNGGSMLTLSYYGAEKTVPNYNVMGVAKAALESSVRYLAADMGENNIRINALSAGPIKTPASSAIGNFSDILKQNEQLAPLKRNVTSQEIGNSAVFLLSPMSSAITGTVLYVDCGYHIVGVRAKND